MLISSVLKIAILFGILLFFTSAQSQVIQTQRYEREDTQFDEEFTIIPLKKDGLVLIRGANKYKSGKRTWELTLIDTLLQEVYPLEFEVDNRNNLIGYEHSEGHCHFLFVRNESNPILELTTIQFSTKEIVSNTINPEFNFKLTHFHKVGTNFIFGGVVNLEPCVLVFNPKNENLKLVPGFFTKNTELMDVRVNQNETFNTLLIDKANVDNRKIIFKTFDSFGNQLLEDISIVEDDLTIQTGICSSLHREDLLIVGAWGKKNSKSASGFYALPVNPFTNEGIKRSYFGQLDHFLDYLKPKRAKAIQLKTKRDLQENKIPDYTNNVMPYKILEHSKGFLVLAESYTSDSNQNYSSSSSVNYPSYNPYYYPYGPYPSNYGRQYIPQYYGANVESSLEHKKIETIAINLDASGNVVWDFSMKFSDVKTQTLQNLSELWLTKDSLFMMYKKEGALKIKSISLATDESVESTQSIKLKEKLDEVNPDSDNGGSIESWYSNSFYTWGYQTIRNKTKSPSRRRVFYINKITVE